MKVLLVWSVEDYERGTTVAWAVLIGVVKLLGALCIVGAVRWCRERPMEARALWDKMWVGLGFVVLLLVLYQMIFGPAHHSDEVINGADLYP